MHSRKRAKQEGYYIKLKDITLLYNTKKCEQDHLKKKVVLNIEIFVHNILVAKINQCDYIEGSPLTYLD